MNANTYFHIIILVAYAILRKLLMIELKNRLKNVINKKLLRVNCLGDYQICYFKVNRLKLFQNYSKNKYKIFDI